MISFVYLAFILWGCCSPLSATEIENERFRPCTHFDFALRNIEDKEWGLAGDFLQRCPESRMKREAKASIKNQELTGLLTHYAQLRQQYDSYIQNAKNNLPCEQSDEKVLWSEAAHIFHKGHQSYPASHFLDAVFCFWAFEPYSLTESFDFLKTIKQLGIPKEKLHFYELTFAAHRFSQGETPYPQDKPLALELWRYILNNIINFQKTPAKALCKIISNIEEAYAQKSGTEGKNLYSLKAAQEGDLFHCWSVARDYLQGKGYVAHLLPECIYGFLLHAWDLTLSQDPRIIFLYAIFLDRHPHVVSRTEKRTWERTVDKIKTDNLDGEDLFARTRAKSLFLSNRNKTSDALALVYQLLKNPKTNTTQCVPHVHDLLGKLHLPDDPKKAIELKQGTELNYPCLSLLLSNNIEETKKATKEDLACLEKCNDFYSYRTLGLMYYDGMFDVKTDRERAKKFFEKAYEMKNPHLEKEYLNFILPLAHLLSCKNHPDDRERINALAREAYTLDPQDFEINVFCAERMLQDPNALTDLPLTQILKRIEKQDPCYAGFLRGKAIFLGKGMEKNIDKGLTLMLKNNTDLSPIEVLRFIVGNRLGYEKDDNILDRIIKTIYTFYHDTPSDHETKESEQEGNIEHESDPTSGSNSGSDATGETSDQEVDKNSPPPWQEREETFRNKKKKKERRPTEKTQQRQHKNQNRVTKELTPNCAQP